MLCVDNNAVIADITTRCWVCGCLFDSAGDEVGTVVTVSGSLGAGCMNLETPE